MPVTLIATGGTHHAFCPHCNRGHTSYILPSLQLGAQIMPFTLIITGGTHQAFHPHCNWGHTSCLYAHCNRGHASCFSAFLYILRYQRKKLLHTASLYIFFYRERESFEQKFGNCSLIKCIYVPASLRYHRQSFTPLQCRVACSVSCGVACRGDRRGERRGDRRGDCRATAVVTFIAQCNLSSQISKKCS